MFVNGDQYEGEWYSDKKHGHGTFTHASGKIEKGQWHFDKLKKASVSVTISSR